MIVSTINLFPETRKTAFDHFHHVVLNLRGKKNEFSVYNTRDRWETNIWGREIQ